MATVLVNNKPVEIGTDRLNCIQAADRAGVEIPHYCWHPDLSVVASCRMCLVEVGDKKPDGTVAMQPKLVPGCQTPVKDGSVIITDSPKVKAAQQATLEYLLLNHPLDCPVCDQAGECGLQDYSFEYGRGYSRLQEPKNIKPDKDYIGDQITLFTDRCIMCTRCVRFTREVSGTAEMQVSSRGSHEEIDIFPGEPCNNKLAGNIVDICPVGALCSKDFLYEQRVWWLKSKKSVCPDCSTGCSINVDQNNDTVYRLKPRYNPLAQGNFMCDDGRFGWKYIHAENRLSLPAQKDGDKVVTNDWDQVLNATRTAFQSAGKSSSKKVAAIFSPWMTVEEAYILASWLKSISPEITLSMTPARVVGEDDTFPKDVHGKPVQPAKFTIRAEKAPNRAGVEAILKHFQGSVIPSGQVLSSSPEALFVVGGDPNPEVNAATASKLGSVKTLAVLDLLDSPLTKKATFVLAGGSFAERDGSFANHSGLVQAINRSLQGPLEARPDGRILSELAGRGAMFNAAKVRAEIAKAIPDTFGSLGDGKLGEYGIKMGPAVAQAEPAAAAT